MALTQKQCPCPTMKTESFENVTETVSDGVARAASKGPSKAEQNVHMA